MDSVDTIAVTLNPAIDRTLTIPGFRAGEVNRVQEDRSKPGGKGLNVATALAEYGQNVCATGFLGKQNPERFENLMAQRGILDRFVRIEGETRTGIKIVDSKSQSTTDINFPGAAPTSQDLDRLLGTLSKITGSWLILGGSLPPGVDSNFYRALSLFFKRRGTQIALDTSGEPLKLALEALPDFVKPNIHELEELLGKKISGSDEVLDAARALIRSGIKLAVVSMGSEGAMFVTSDEAVIAIPPSIQVGSTVGAGDAMVAGVIAAQHQGYSLEATAKLATAFSVSLLSSGEIGDKAALDRLQTQVCLR